MNPMSDSQATYCSEVEELMKLTTELNKPWSNVSVRRSQRLSQKRLIGCSIFENNGCIHASDKVIRKSQPTKQLSQTKESLKVDCLQKTTQDVFSTQEVRELALTNLTCGQHKAIVAIPEKDEPLNLSMNKKRSANVLHPDAALADLTNKRKMIVALNENSNTTRVPMTTFPKNKKLFGTQKKSVHLNVSMKSQGSQKINNSIKTLNENAKQHWSSNNDVKALQYASVQDFQQKQPIKNFDNEIIRPQSNPSIITKTKGRPRKTHNTEKQNNKKSIKCLVKNKKINMNFQEVNEMEYGKNVTTKNTQKLTTKSILPDVYPSHFKYQLPPEAVLSRPLVPYPTIITPEYTPSYELDNSSSSSPSLPDSLRGIFDTDDIKEILNIDKVSYRLCDYHVQALAVILNLRVEFLFQMLDKILQINTNVLKNFDKAMKMPFVEDRDLFETTPEESFANEDVVQNSQSPKDRKILTHTKSNFRQKMF